MAAREPKILRAVQISSTPMLFPFKKRKWLNSFASDQKPNLFPQRFLYEKFYGFSKDPFDSQPDPRHIFLTVNVREVWNIMLSGIGQKKGFFLLTGERGIGKTTLVYLINLYLATNGGRVKAVLLLDSNHRIKEILLTSLQGLGFSQNGESKGSMLRRLNEDLAQRSARGETVALIIDEAQNLGKETLEEVRLLASPNPKHPRLLQEIFVGDPQFEQNLMTRGLSLLNQRIEVRCRLRPFSPAESLGYIKHRLNLAGRATSRVFNPTAISLIIRACGGNPGTLNRVCQGALAAGYSQWKRRIDLANVREALANLGMGKKSSRLLPPQKRAWFKRSLRKASP
jgi:general secretion pathway protein A